MKKYSVSGIFYTDGAVYISHLSDMRYGILFVATKDAELLNVIGNVLYPDEWAYRADFW